MYHFIKFSRTFLRLTAPATAATAATGIKAGRTERLPPLTYEAQEQRSCWWRTGLAFPSVLTTVHVMLTQHSEDGSVHQRAFQAGVSACKCVENARRVRSGEHRVQGG